ncbi:MAG: TldD/PmbA family protein [Acidobacteriota bacterium]
MIPEELARQVLGLAVAGGGDSAELFAERRTETMLRMNGSRVEESTTGVDQGVGLSLLDGQQTLYANGNRFDGESLVRMADRLARARSMIRQSVAAPPSEREQRVIEFTPEPLSLVSPVSVPAATVSIQRKAQVLQRADDAARGHDERITQVTVTYRDVQQHVQIATTEGRLCSEVRQHITISVTAVACEGTQISTGTDSRGETRGFEFFDMNPPEDVGREAARLAVHQLVAKPAPGGTFTVVLSSKAGGTMVHEACGHGLEADFIRKSLSVYTGKLGQPVASRLVTVVDDGTLANLHGSSAIDDEGVPTSRTVLIERGILRGFLHSRKTAREMKEQPTGHGRRESYRHLPIPRMRNTMILPGRTPPDQMLVGIREGVLVCRMGGGEVDVTTGNFVFNCPEAYMIRNGRVAEPIRGATLIGNGPEVLGSIDKVGAELGFGVGTCGKDGQQVPVADAQPSLRIPHLIVGGQAPA